MNLRRDLFKFMKLTDFFNEVISPKNTRKEAIYLVKLQRIKNNK